MMKSMRRMVLCLMLFALAGLLFGQRREIRPVEFRKISDRLYEILEGRGARGGFYIGDDAVLVVDAKMDKSSVDETIEGIHRLTDKPIRYLVNTHSDGDHVYGNRYFPESVAIIAHENCRKEFFHANRNGDPSEWTNPELMPFVPSITFATQMMLHLGSKSVELWHFGAGHTTGDAVVYFPEEKTAFIGDQIFFDRPQLIHSYKGGNSFGHVKNLKRMLDTLDAEHFCSGHGDMTNREGIESHIAAVEKLQDRVRVLMANRRSLEQIKAEFEEREARLVESIYHELQAGAKDL